MSTFEYHVGIDYSGRGRPGDALRQIRVAAEQADGSVGLIPNPHDGRGRWSRQDLAHWLDKRLNEPAPCIVGIDHAFSFPQSFLNDRDLSTWDEFLDWFDAQWPTREMALKDLVEKHGAYPTRDLRLTERWTSSAKSVFQLVGQGNVGCSTHCGIPWLAWLRRRHRERLHFWPFDGLSPTPDRSVIAEVYPSVLRRRYQETIQRRFPSRTLSLDEQDALSVALWLKEADASGFLDRYFDPPLNEDDRARALREGWILGIA